jgi:hypothetical protein
VYIKRGYPHAFHSSYLTYPSLLLLQSFILYYLNMLSPSLNVFSDVSSMSPPPSCPVTPEPYMDAVARNGWSCGVRRLPPPLGAPQNYVLEEFLPLPLPECPATSEWHEPGNTPPTTWGEVDPWHPSWDQPQRPDSPICWRDEVAQLGWGLDASYLYDE